MCFVHLLCVCCLSYDALEIETVLARAVLFIFGGLGSKLIVFWDPDGLVLEGK